MSDSEINELTHHAMLVAWGEFAQSIGLIQEIERVSLYQKTVTHRPQTKTLEFFVAILAGLEHLKDLSRSAHPIDQDRAVAKAWLQPAWADYSGVSRTLTTLYQEEVEQVAGVLHKITKLILDEKVMNALQVSGRLTYDGDLTGRPVSNSSTTYPNVGYGHMDDAIRLGYQAAMVSVHSPTYGRLWLSVVPHPGNAASCTQVEAMVLAAEAKTGLRPLRRTDLLRGRLQCTRRERQGCEAQVQAVEAGVKEGKGVFEMHHLKVRSAPGLYLQEQFAVFAANFVRWAAHWLATQCPQLPSGWQETSQPRVKEQVKSDPVQPGG